MTAEEVGRRIAALRKEKGLTQKELAAQLSVTDKAVSKWEQGKNFPDLTTLEPLAAALGTSPAALLGLDGESPESVLAAGTEIHEQERLRWLQEMRSRAWWAVVICVTMFVFLTLLARRVRNEDVYLAREIEPFCTGMNCFIGALLGNAHFTLRTVRRRLREAPEKLPSAPDRSS